MDTGLVFDIGVNHGEDTFFYLAKGFRVVGVEANPTIYANLCTKFADEIERNQLTLLNIGISMAEGVAPFFVNEDNDHWSSFIEAYGTRSGTRFHIVPIQCTTVSQLLTRYGTPHYMKVDIEGMDRTVLEQMREIPGRPTFISVEEYGVCAIDDLHELGYRRFKLAPQRDKSWSVPPNPPLEGHYIHKTFDGRDTGLFGRELPGDWLPSRQARDYFLASVRREDHTYVGPENEWFDIHATN